jgi:hypothetical protein
MGSMQRRLANASRNIGSFAAVSPLALIGGGFGFSSLDGLIALIQASVLEIHPWGSRIRKVEAPDRITFDLTPARMSRGLP